MSVVEGECSGVFELDVEDGASSHENFHGQCSASFSGLAPDLPFAHWEVEFIHATGEGQIHGHGA